MWRLTLLCLLSIRRVSPTLSVGNLDGSLSGHATDPEGVAENAWYPGVSLLGPVGGPSSNPLAMPSDSGAVVGGSADLELEVWCLGDQLTLGVRAMPGGVALDPDALTLGDGCKSNGLSVDYLWFTYDLTECGTRQSVLDGDVVYSNVLQYAPEPSSSALQQVEAFSLPVYCTLDRNQGYASPVMMSVPVSTKSLGPGFSLRAMNGSWTGAAESVVFRWGEAVRLQAAVGRVGEEQQLYVPSCHATATPDPKSRPRVRLIMKKGCVAYVVSRRGHARFVPSERTDAVNFLFAAFSFAAPEIYLHCELAVLGQEMTSGSKFCNYNQKRQRWEELSGDIAVCGCCRTQCPDPAPSSAPAGLHALVTVGPLVVERRGGVGGAGEPEAPPPTALPSAPPVARATTPAAPGPSLPTAFPEPSPPGFPEFPPQAAWAGPLSPDDVAVLDGFPVPDPPPGWVAAGAGSTRVTWVYPPALAHGGVLIVRRVPVDPGSDPLTSPQNLDDEVRWRSYHDDPSALDVWGQGSPGNGRSLPPVSYPDPVLEESGRKRWGLALGALVRLRSEPADREADGSRHGDTEVDPLAEVGLEGEGLVVQRTEVIRHKGRGRPYPEVLSALRSRLALTRSEGTAQKLRYEEEEQGLAQEEGVMKRRVLLEEDNVRPSSLRAVLRRMYKAE